MILSDKADMRKIKFNMKFLGFARDTLCIPQISMINGKNKFFIKSDKKRLQQVLLNLLSNAIKFSNVDSTVDINVEY